MAEVQCGDLVVFRMSQFSHDVAGEGVGRAESFKASETGLPALTMCLKLRVPGLGLKMRRELNSGHSRKARRGVDGHSTLTASAM